MFIIMILGAPSATLAFITNDDFKLADSLSDLPLCFDLLVVPSIICSSPVIS